MIKDNKISCKKRLKELLIDYMVILLYLLLLFTLTMVFSALFINDTPDFKEIHLQIISFFTSVLPIVLIFSFLDYGKGSLGKQKTGLKVYYRIKSPWASILRNIIKFLPWQLAHIGVIRGIYNNFDLVSIMLTSASLVLAFSYFLMGLVRKDKRHLGDLFGGTQVQNR
jgi:uncharacterized RDD family membrane protein YckC